MVDRDYIGEKSKDFELDDAVEPVLPDGLVLACILDEQLFQLGELSLLQAVVHQGALNF